ncbi:MAG: hypothetical protein J07HQW1_02144, partial [Haloquadratum walsbyi J07HQW1]
PRELLWTMFEYGIIIRTVLPSSHERELDDIKSYDHLNELDDVTLFDPRQ